MSDVHELIRKARAGTPSSLPARSTKSANERRAEDARRRKTKKVKPWSRSTGVRTTRARAPESVLPPVTPAHDIDAIREEAYADAAGHLIGAVLTDELLTKVIAQGDAEGGPYTVRCECGWRSDAHTLLANAVTEHEIHLDEEHDGEAPAPARPTKLLSFFTRT